jgi:hypothetical protein
VREVADIGRRLRPNVAELKRHAGLAPGFVESGAHRKRAQRLSVGVLDRVGASSHIRARVDPPDQLRQFPRQLDRSLYVGFVLPDPQGAIM